jgi:hypothetical protein
MVTLYMEKKKKIKLHTLYPIKTEKQVELK